MAGADGVSEERLLAGARRGDEAAFELLVGRYRGELYAHCYRMLGSVQDAEDAVQESLLGAWRGLAGFEGRSSLRSWLYRVATNACLRLSSRRPRRMLSFEYGPACSDPRDLGEPVTGPVWLEPWPDEPPAGDEPDPASASVRRESVELAFVAALQHLPGTQRAVLLLREVLEFSAAEVAGMLDTTPASVNSALQRARATVARRVPQRSQQTELAALGPGGRSALVDAFVTAWERADVPALLDLLTEDARFTMPPLPAWFDGREGIRRFLVERMFTTPWRLVPIAANGQPAFACYQMAGELRMDGSRQGSEQQVARELPMDGSRQDSEQQVAGERYPVVSDQAIASRPFATPRPPVVSDQDVASRPLAGEGFRLGAVNVLSLRDGRVSWIAGFVDPQLYRHFPMPAEFSRPDR